VIGYFKGLSLVSFGYLTLFEREYFYFVDQVHISTLHGGQYAACYEAHMNFANESGCLMADDVWNEGK
jgi:hypothetical protein